MMMKIHSYLATNGYLSFVYSQVQSSLAELRRLTEDPAIGGWDKALEDAKINRIHLDKSETSSEGDNSSTSQGYGIESPAISGTPTVPEGSATSYIDVKSAAQLRKRLNMSSKALQAQVDEPGHSHKVDSTGNSIIPPASVHKPGPHPLVDHLDPRVHELALEISEMEAELVSTGPEYVRWPDNVTWKNFAVYMLIPTLVYELEYPRTDRYVTPHSPSEKRQIHEI